MADRIHGVDISEYQASWKPNSAGAGSDQFVFIKTSEGQSWKSSTAANQAKVARDAGLVVGHYHFLWPSAASGSPSKQADWFLSCIPSLRAGEILWCDWEGTGGGTPTGTDKDQFMAAVKDRVGSANKVGLYVNASMWNGSNKNKGDSLWLAQYASNPSVSGWDFWQYTDNPIDQNWGAFSSRSDLEDWAEGNIPVGDGILGMSTVEKYHYSGS